MKNVLALARNREMSLVAITFVVAAVLFIAMSVWATTIGTNMDATGTLGAATSTPWGTLAAEQVATQGSIDPTFVVGDTGSTTPFIFVSPKGVVSFGSSSPSALLLNAADVVIGRNGSTNDLYISGGLGVGNATTADSNLEVQTRIYAGTVISTGSYFYSAGSATSTFVGSGLLVGSGGLASSNGLTLLGGVIRSTGNLNITSSATSTWGSSQWADLTVDAVANQTRLHGIFAAGDNGTTTPFLFVTQKGKVRVGTTSASAQDELIVDSLESNATSTIHLGNKGSVTNGSCLQMYNSAGASYKIFLAKASTTVRLAMELGTCE